ncbi:MAG TPA: cobalt transporter CbiM [Syntrophothermus lipocalidus]|nr:cobalt transporter CbiM [Syntrophothermus lipocalidus]
MELHIPDGYLSPQTAIPFIGAMVPIWAAATKKVKSSLKKKDVPLVALGAAFSFVIMMFNVPIPGGSSGHAVGAVLLAILMGPWAACIAVSTALIIQALVFGDGGILAIGANCFNMAVAMPFFGYYVYKWIKGSAPGLSRRALWAAAIAGYLGINLAALFTSVEFGSQYHLFRAADGTPLYFMYPLKVAVSTMMTEHLLIAGPIEAVITALGLGFVAKSYPSLISEKDPVLPNNSPEVSING